MRPAAQNKGLHAVKRLILLQKGFHDKWVAGFLRPADRGPIPMRGPLWASKRLILSCSRPMRSQGIVTFGG